MAGAVSRFKSIMNEKVVSFCLLGVLFWMPDIYMHFLFAGFGPRASAVSIQISSYYPSMTIYIYMLMMGYLMDLMGIVVRFFMGYNGYTL